MGLTMQKILDKYSDCDTFSLTGGVVGYNVSDKEFLNALNKIESMTKEEKRAIYENNKDKFMDYPEFDVLYEEVQEECYNFNSKENKQKYIDKNFDRYFIAKMKKSGMTNEEINAMKENFFSCSFIADDVGDKTKYGKENGDFFWGFYHDIAMNIDRQKSMKKYCVKNEKNLLDQIPQEIKKHFLHYEVSFFNTVTISDRLMVNYYFRLNDETKKYLLNFRNDFCLDELQDLTLYKDNEIEFYSCAHEGYNSIEVNYKNMSNKEIIDFINDEFWEEDNDIIIEVVSKLINMEVNNKFSFRELGIIDEELKEKICSVCDKLKLVLVSSTTNLNNWNIIDNGEFEQVEYLPAILCSIEDLIEKIH